MLCRENLQAVALLRRMKHPCKFDSVDCRSAGTQARPNDGGLASAGPCVTTNHLRGRLFRMTDQDQYQIERDIKALFQRVQNLERLLQQLAQKLARQ
jgi:hypothetical protein